MKRLERVTLTITLALLSASPIFRGVPPLEWQCWQAHGQVLKASAVWHCFTDQHPQRGQE